MAPAPPETLIVTVDLTTLQRFVQEAVRDAVRDGVARNQAADADALLTAEQAAALTGRTANAIRVASSRGLLPSVRQGRSVRFRRSDVLAGWE